MSLLIGFGVLALAFVGLALYAWFRILPSNQALMASNKALTSELEQTRSELQQTRDALDKTRKSQDELQDALAICNASHH